MHIFRKLIASCFLAGLIAIPSANVRGDEGDDLYNLALGEIRQKRFELAAKSLEELIAKHPAHPKTEIGRLRLGVTYQSLKQHEPARKHLRAFVQRNPDSQNLGEAMYRVGFSSFHLGEMKEAEQEFAAFHAKFPQHDYREWSLVYLGYAQLQNGKPKEAGPSFEAALKAFPQGEMFEDAEFGLARVYESTEQPENAVKLYTKLSQNPAGLRNEQALMKLGGLHFELQQFAESAKAYDDLASKYPRSDQLPTARMNAGYAYFRASKFESAAERFAEAARAESQAVTAHYWKGLSEKTLGRYPAAVQSFSAAVESLPSDSPQLATIRYQWADAEYLQGHYAEAEPIFLAALNADPKSEVADAALHRAALSCLAQNKTERAAELVARFQQEYPQSPLIDYVTLLSGQIQIATAGDDNLKAAEAALRQLLMATQIDSLKDLTRYQLARSLEKQNRCEEALETLTPLTETLTEQSSSDLIQALLLEAECHRRLAQRTLLEARPLRAQIATFQTSDSPTATDELKQRLSAVERVAETHAAKSIAALDRFVTLLSTAANTPSVLQIRAVCEAILGEQEKVRAALKSYTSATTPAEAAALVLEVAEIVYDWERYEWAAELFATATGDETPEASRPPALSGLGWSQYKLQQFDRSASTFARLATEFSGSSLAPEAHFQQADSLRLAGKTTEARQAFAGLLDLYEAKPVGVRTPGLEEFARKAGLEAARMARKESEAEQADRLYLRVYESFPQMPNLEAFLYEWAVANVNAEQFDRADEVFRLLIRKFPESLHVREAQLILAENAVAAGKLDEGKAAFLKIVEDEQVSTTLRKNALSHLIRLELTRQNWSEVARWSAVFAEKYPADPFRYDAERYLAEALLFQNKDSEAEKILTRLYDQRDEPPMKAVPWRPQLWILLAEASVRQKNYERVDSLAAELATVEGSEPFRYQMQEVLGRSLKNRAKFAEARAAYQSAIDDKHGQKTETAAKSQFYLGEISVLQKDYETALEEFLKVYLLYKFPKWQAPALYQAGQCDERLEHFDKALTSYEDLLRDFPESEFAPLAQKRIAALKQK